MDFASLAIEHDLILLCEGKADNAFFDKLIDNRKLPLFSFPFPTKKSLEPEYKGPPFWGRDGFFNMLDYLSTYFKHDPREKQRIKGLLLAVDAGNRPKHAFEHVAKQVKKAGDFAVPDKILTLAKSKSGYPPVAIMVVPGADEPGGLETLCVKELSGRSKEYKAIAGHMESYLGVCSTKPLEWGKEKADKARLQCLIAATYKNDPTKAISLAFRSKPPVIDIKAKCFDAVVDQIRNFCEQLGVS